VRPCPLNNLKRFGYTAGITSFLRIRQEECDFFLVHELCCRIIVCQCHGHAINPLPAAMHCLAFGNTTS
jgi:hypothetical protein